MKPPQHTHLYNAQYGPHCLAQGLGLGVNEEIHLVFVYLYSLGKGPFKFIKKNSGFITCDNFQKIKQPATYLLVAVSNFVKPVFTRRPAIIQVINTQHDELAKMGEETRTT